MFNIKEFLLENEISFSPENRRNYIVLDVCPFCDKKKKYNILTQDDPSNDKIKAGYSKCYSCGASGMVGLVAQIKHIKEEDAKRIVFRGWKRKEESEDFSLKFLKTEYNSLSNSTPRHQLPDEVINFTPVPLPKYSSIVCKEKNPKAFEYLIKRGFSEEDVKRLGVGILDHDLYSLKTEINRDDSLETNEERENIYKELRPLLGRVIIPVVFNKTNMGYVARDFTGEKDPAYKVLNSRGPLTTTFCFNYDGVKKSEVLVINEGLFDSVKCGLNRSIALLGKGISPDSAKVRLIKRLNPKTVVIYLDNGAYKDATYLASVLATHFKDIRIVFQKPYLNKKISPQLSEILKKILKDSFSEDENGVFFHPNLLWGIKEFIKGIDSIGDHQNMPLIKGYFEKRFKLPVYKSKPDGLSLVKTILDRYQAFGPSVKTSFCRVISEVKSIGYIDAGDRTFEENEELINNALPYSPGMYIEEVA